MSRPWLRELEIKVSDLRSGRLSSADQAPNHDFAFAEGLREAMRASTPAGVAMHDLATEVIQRHVRFGRRGLAICGASYGSGVTLTAAALAVALAESGISTILVEANLRRPGLDALITPANPVHGLAQYLRSETDRLSVINFEVLDNLAVVFAGGVAGSDAGQLLASHRFQEFLNAAMRDFECVIIDAPPANRYADARAIAVAVGYAAIVGRRHFSFINDAEHLARQLIEDGVVVVGTIFNRG